MKHQALKPNEVDLKSFYQKARCVALVLALFCASRSLPAASDTTQKATDYEGKAAFIYNIGRFVDWPQAALGKRIVIGIDNDVPMVTVMKKFFVDKRIGSRPVEVREVHSRSELRACNMLLISSHDSTRVRELLEQLQGANVLTIGEGEQFVKLGGVVALTPHENTYQLSINPKGAERGQLKISSKLMSMATVVSESENH